jgi:hypothetical protein
MGACQRLVIYSIPKPEAMAKSNDPKVVLNSAWDLLRLAYVLAFGYERGGTAEQGRQIALRSFG